MVVISQIMLAESPFHPKLSPAGVGGGVGWPSHFGPEPVAPRTPYSAESNTGETAASTPSDVLPQPPEGSIATIFRRELEGVPFSDPRARAFRDLVDVVSSAIEAEESPEDIEKQLTLALVKERVSAKVNEDQSYGEAFLSLIDRIDGLLGEDYDTNKTMVQGMDQVAYDLYYPQFKTP